MPALVAIPVYKPAPDAREQFALRQCQRTLAAHPITFVAPAALDLAPYLALVPGAGAQRFEADYFRSINGYNRLMLSPAFYDAFAAYEYLLIHQTDAVVFSDQLAAWCARGYDYIGAPWVRDWHFQPAWQRWPKAWRSALAQRLQPAPGSRWCRYVPYGLVGNGGLSLRRVATFREVLAAEPAALAAYRQPVARQFNEDVFWSYAARLNGQPLRTPDWREALGFAMEYHVPQSLRLLGGLPFGCHAWERQGSDWQGVFQQLALGDPPA